MFSHKWPLRTCLEAWLLIYNLQRKGDFLISEKRVAFGKLPDTWRIQKQQEKKQTLLGQISQFKLGLWRRGVWGQSYIDTVLTPLECYIHRQKLESDQQNQSLSNHPPWVLFTSWWTLVSIQSKQEQKEQQAKWELLGGRHSQQLTSSDLSTQSWSPSHTHSAKMQRPSPQRCSFVGLQSREKEKSWRQEERAREILDLCPQIQLKRIYSHCS